MKQKYEFIYEDVLEELSSKREVDLFCQESSDPVWKGIDSWLPDWNGGDEC